MVFKFLPQGLGVEWWHSHTREGEIRTPATPESKVHLETSNGQPTCGAWSPGGRSGLEEQMDIGRAWVVLETKQHRTAQGGSPGQGCSGSGAWERNW